MKTLLIVSLLCCAELSEASAPKRFKKNDTMFRVLSNPWNEQRHLERSKNVICAYQMQANNIKHSYFLKKKGKFLKKKRRKEFLCSIV